MKKIIYLDYNAASPLDPRVNKVMQTYHSEIYANSASQHMPGWQARTAVENFRKNILKHIGANDGAELVFTSGATESNNLVLFGSFYQSKRKFKILSQPTEHSSVLEPLQKLVQLGAEVDFVPVDASGLIDLEKLKSKLRQKYDLVSIMLAQNETGVIQPLGQIADLCHDGGALLHTDATQAVGKIFVDANKWAVDLMSFSAHKLGGPKGIGALYVSRRQPNTLLEPLLYGGGHENGLRSGTLNVPAIAGLSHALELRSNDLPILQSFWSELKKRLWDLLHARFPEMTLNGSLEHTLSNTLNVCIPGIKSDQLIIKCPEVAFATGAACSSNHTEPSHVLLAMGLTKEEANASLRFSFGMETTREDVERAAELILRAIDNERK